MLTANRLAQNVGVLGANGDDDATTDNQPGKETCQHGALPNMSWQLTHPALY
jgi:hypothetical protein